MLSTSPAFFRHDNRLGSEFVCLKQSGAKLWIKRELLETPTAAMLLDSDSLFNRSDCRIIKDERKIKVGRVVMDVAGKSTAVFVKRYNAFSWGYRLISMFSTSGAYCSLRGASILTQAQIQTAAPLAAVEWRRWGMVERSIFVSREIESGKTADAYWLKNLGPITGRDGFVRRREFLKSLARLFRQLHSKALYHNDLKDANVLVKTAPGGKGSFFLLDLEGVRRCLYVSHGRKIKNLVQLNRTLGKFLSRTQRLLFLTNYLGALADDRRILRRWVSRLQRATTRAEKRSLAKRSREE